jgi:UDP-glucose 4-epimerase
MQRVLITGGAGFIGSHVIERFQRAGWGVEVLDDLSTGKADNVPAGVPLHRLDIRSPEAAKVVTNGFDVVVHLAAQMDVRRSVADPVFDANTNVIGTLNLTEAIRGTDRRPRFVFASSGGAVYGDFTTPPNVETFAKDPESPYAVSKLAVEYYLGYYGRVHAMETVTLRYANVYGPRQDPHGEAGVVAIFCGRILEGAALKVFGDGRQTRDYVYVGDVAEATFRAATCPAPTAGQQDARAFNGGTGCGTSVLELVESLARAADTKPVVEFAPARPGEQLHSVVAIDRAGAELGWTPATSLDAGLQLTFDWFAARHHQRTA